MAAADHASQLLPPNSTELERALVHATAREVAIDFPNRSLWSADDCPESLLPWLAWAVGVQTWQSDWPAAIKRRRIKTAIETMRHRGTALSLKNVVESFGGGLTREEWWQTDPPRVPHTFRVILEDADQGPFSVELQKDLYHAVDTIKPARSTYQVTGKLNPRAAIGTAAEATGVAYRRLDATTNNGADYLMQFPHAVIDAADTLRTLVCHDLAFNLLLAPWMQDQYDELLDAGATAETFATTFCQNLTKDRCNG